MKITIEIGGTRITIERPDIQGEGRRKMEEDTYQDALGLARRIVELRAPLNYEDAHGAYQVEPVKSEAWNSPQFRNYLHGKHIK